MLQKNQIFDHYGNMTDLPANVVEIGNLTRFKIALKSYMRISYVFIHLRS